MRHFWQMRVYDNESPNKQLVDIPESEIESIEFEDNINGGPGAATITFRRSFNNIGALAYNYTIQIWIWGEVIPDALGPPQQPVDPYWAGYFLDFDQEEMATTGKVIAKCEGLFKQLDRFIVTEEVNPGVSGNPSLAAGGPHGYLQHLLDTYQPTDFGAPTIPFTMFDMLPNRFDGTKLGACIDTITKLGRDGSGLLFTWAVRGKVGLGKAVVIQSDQNPNVVSGVYFIPLFKGSDFYEYKIKNVYRDIVNTVAVYGGKDPVSGQQIYGVFEDATSVALFGNIEDKISVPALQDPTAIGNYASVWLDLHGFPQPQGELKLFNPRPDIVAGTWVMIWEAATDDPATTIVKQVRVANVKVRIDGERISQTLSTLAPVPYLDEAVYRMGLHSYNVAAAATRSLPLNTQTNYILDGCGVSKVDATHVAVGSGHAVFNGTKVTVAAVASLAIPSEGSWIVRLSSAGTVDLVSGGILNVDATHLALANVVTTS